MKYKIVIYWSSEDQGYIAAVPDLPGCVADGRSYQEALKAVEAVAAQWIETARELGRAIPEPESPGVTV